MAVSRRLVSASALARRINVPSAPCHWGRALNACELSKKTFTSTPRVAPHDSITLTLLAWGRGLRACELSDMTFTSTPRMAPHSSHTLTLLAWGRGLHARELSERTFITARARLAACRTL